MLTRATGVVVLLPPGSRPACHNQQAEDITENGKKNGGLKAHDNKWNQSHNGFSAHHQVPLNRGKDCQGKTGQKTNNPADQGEPSHRAFFQFQGRHNFVAKKRTVDAPESIGRSFQPPDGLHHLVLIFKKPHDVTISLHGSRFPVPASLSFPSWKSTADA